MVTVINYESVEKENGETFLLLILQGGVEAVRNENTGKMYFTARTVKVPATFNEETCRSIVGNKFEGSIKKVVCEPYQYRLRESSETITLDYRYEFVSEIEQIIQDHIVEKELVK